MKTEKKKVHTTRTFEVGGVRVISDNEGMDLQILEPETDDWSTTVTGREEVIWSLKELLAFAEGSK